MVLGRKTLVIVNLDNSRDDNYENDNFEDESTKDDTRHSSPGS